MEGAIIQNEWEEVIDPEEMIRIIAKRKGRDITPLLFSPDWFEVNGAEPTKEGLSRRKLGDHVVSWGEGTWDCVIGYFS